LGEVIEWLGDEADREWERAKDGLSDGYGGFDAYMRTIQHCQDMLMDDTAEHGKPDEGDDEMNPEDNPMPLVSECNPVDAVECPCCLTVFRVRTLMTDGAGRLMRDEYETIPMFCPMCGGRLEQSERKE
jgi:hypothetical protein